MFEQISLSNPLVDVSTASSGVTVPAGCYAKRTATARVGSGAYPGQVTAGTTLAALCAVPRLDPATTLTGVQARIPSVESCFLPRAAASRQPELHDLVAVFAGGVLFAEAKSLGEMAVRATGDADFTGGITTLRTSVVDHPAAARKAHASGAFLRALRTAFGEAFRRSHPDPAAPLLLPAPLQLDGDAAQQLWTEVISAEAVGSESEAIDSVFGNLDRWLDLGEFGRVNHFFRIVRPERLSTSTLLSVLTVTLPYGPLLAGRDAFVGSIRAHLSATESAVRVASLLRGLA